MASTATTAAPRGGARVHVQAPPPPLFLAALGPEMVKLGGELADGLVLNAFADSLHDVFLWAVPIVVIIFGPSLSSSVIIAVLVVFFVAFFNAYEGGTNISPDLINNAVLLGAGKWDVLREIRGSTRVPVIMLTARGEEMDRVLGLELGADDYVTKPFSAAELIARLRAVLRRSGPVTEPAGSTLEVGDVVMNLETHRVTKAGEHVDLTVKEYELLRVLLEHAGKVVRRNVLVEEVWDPNWFGSTKTVDVHMSALRKKLGDDPGSPTYVHTVRGVGFRFASPAELAE